MSRKTGLYRNPHYYTLNAKVSDPKRSPLFRQALLFDGKQGQTSRTLMQNFNRRIRRMPRYASKKLLEETVRIWPAEILIINASNDRLPLSWETARITRELFKKFGKKIPVHVIDTRKELVRRVRRIRSGALILSQCVDKNIYNISIARDLIRKYGAVIVPGPATAPGGVLSDKARTYRLCTRKQARSPIVAPFIRVAPRRGGVPALTEGIFRAMQTLERTRSIRHFFVKPTEGGGGLGGFRISREKDRFFLPDLSKVSSSFTQVHPSYLTFPLNNQARQDELLWIMDHFSRDPLLKKTYLKTNITKLKKRYRTPSKHRALRSFLAETQARHAHMTHDMALPKSKIRRRLSQALKEFEKKYKRRYIATVNKHISFGTWGLRAHYRIGTKGPVLESLYARIFQLSFTPEGIGYVGGDNISNKQTGELEVGRLVPLNPIMVRAIGGRKKLFRTLEKGLAAMLYIHNKLSVNQRSRIPIRVQMDLAPIAGLIGEGNADTARGMSLATHWPTFIQNAEEWVTDALRYYSYCNAGSQTSEPKSEPKSL